jgi:Zn-dependent alcohol dehydrogenase
MAPPQPPPCSKRTYAVVRRLLGDGDNTQANPGTFENVEVARGPELGACGVGEVLVGVRAACVNYPDLLQTVGGYQHKPRLPFTPGQEVAGVVRAVRIQCAIPRSAIPGAGPKALVCVPG